MVMVAKMCLFLKITSSYQSKCGQVNNASATVSKPQVDVSNESVTEGKENESKANSSN